MHPATELRNTLTVAARSQMQFGASRSQIEYIIALARGSNCYNVTCGGRLTKQDAAQIIDQMILDGAVADYTITDGEEEDEIEIAKRVAAKTAAKSAKKAQDKARKAAQSVPIVTDPNAKRVSHKTFGAGVLIAEDEKAYTVVFDRKPGVAQRLLRAYVSLETL